MCPSLHILESLFLNSIYLLEVFSWNWIVIWSFGMVSEIYVKLYLAELDFFEKNIMPQKCWKWAKNGPSRGFFEFIENMLFDNESLYLCCGPGKFHIWENFGSWIVDQNAFSQSNCRIFKSTIYSEKINEIAWFFDVDTNSRKLKVDCKSFDFWCQGSIAVVLCSVVI